MSQPFGNYQKRKFISPKKKSFHNHSPKKKVISPQKNDINKSQTSILNYCSPNSDSKRARFSEDGKNCSTVKKSLFSEPRETIHKHDEKEISDTKDLRRVNVEKGEFEYISLNSSYLKSLNNLDTIDHNKELNLNNEKLSSYNDSQFSKYERIKTTLNENDNGTQVFLEISPTKSNLSVEEAELLVSDIDWWDGSDFQDQITKTDCSSMTFNCEKTSAIGKGKDLNVNRNCKYDGDQDKQSSAKEECNLQANNTNENASCIRQKQVDSERKKTISSSSEDNDKIFQLLSDGNIIEPDLINYIINTPTAAIAWKTIFSHSIFQNIYKNYMSLPFEEKRLYSRLYCRKYDWIRLENIKYDFVPDIKMALTNLKTIGFIEFLDPNTVDLKVALNLLQLDEIKNACGKISVNKKGNKSSLINDILKRIRSQTTLKFGNITPTNKMKQQIFQNFPTFIKLEEKIRNLFTSFLIISTYPQFKSRDDSRTTIVIDLLYKLKNGTVRKLEVPLCPIPIFKSLAQFKEYENSVNLVDQLFEAKKNKYWDKATELVLQAKLELKLYLGNKKNIADLEEMFEFLKKYTPGSNYVYAINEGIDVLKKKKGEAADLETEECLKLLLSQRYFKKGRQAFWNYELALLMERWKNYDKVFLTLKQGLLEKSITPVGKVLLSDRCELLIKRKNGLSAPQKKELMELIKDQPFHYKTTIITAQAMPNVTNTKQMWKKQTEEGHEYMSVEEVARRHYSSDEGGSYTEGYHDEGRIIIHIALCTFWKVIYAPLEGMFHVPLQDRPIDWGSSAFYRNRADLIQEHKERLLNMGVDGIMKEITEVCSQHSSTISVISWELIKLENLKDIEKFIESMGFKPFLEFCDYLLKAYKERSSGLPDLTLWNVNKKKSLFVEVKGPTDRLSQKQIVWLQKLKEIGLETEVCHVNTLHTGKREN